MDNASAQEIDALRACGSLLAAITHEVAQTIHVGMNTAALDQLFKNRANESGAETPFLGYRDFPASICTSRNSVIVHGIPSKNDVLQEGDIIGLDCGLHYRGVVTDMAVTVPVGQISAEAARLIAVTREALNRAISFLKPGVTTGDLGAHIQQYVEGEGFSVIRDLVGHGVGREIHEDPAIPNFGTRGRGERFASGMVIAVEPMVAAGDWHVETLPDGWTVRMKDGSLGAHFEHTLLITESGAEILTKK